MISWNFILGFHINEGQSRDTESKITLFSNISISSIVTEDEKAYTCALFNKNDKQWVDNTNQSVYLEVRGKFRQSDTNGGKHSNFSVTNLQCFPVTIIMCFYE